MYLHLHGSRCWGSSNNGLVCQPMATIMVAIGFAPARRLARQRQFSALVLKTVLPRASVSVGKHIEKPIKTEACCKPDGWDPAGIRWHLWVFIQIKATCSRFYDSTPGLQFCRVHHILFFFLSSKKIGNLLLKCLPKGNQLSLQV